jgi:hypothetical protein
LSLGIPGSRKLPSGIHGNNQNSTHNPDYRNHYQNFYQCETMLNAGKVLAKQGSYQCETMLNAGKVLAKQGSYQCETMVNFIFHIILVPDL